MFGRLFSCDMGNVSTVLALALIPLTLSAGVAIDYIRLITAQTKLQATADAAALAGASINGGSDAQRTAAAAKSFEANLPDSMAGLAPGISIKAGKLTVAATATLDPSIMNIAGFKATGVPVQATAAYRTSPASCIIALHPGDKESVYINSDSQIVSPDCALQVNSSSGEALVGNSNGDVTAKGICVAGGWKTNSGSEFAPSPKVCPPITDPLAALPVPDQADDACDYNNKVFTGTKTLSPGVYCGKTEFNSGANITLLPGIYVIRDGEFVVNSGSDSAGDGVMFYLTGSNNARINLNSGSHIDISAPTSGTYAGIAIFQQRNSSADYSIVNSDSSSVIEGTIYLPNTPLHINSAGTVLSSAPWTMIVVSKIEVNSHSTLKVNANYDASVVPVPAGLGGGSKLVHLTE